MPTMHMLSPMTPHVEHYADRTLTRTPTQKNKGFLGLAPRKGHHACSLAPAGGAVMALCLNSCFRLAGLPGRLRVADGELAPPT